MLISYQLTNAKIKENEKKYDNIKQLTLDTTPIIPNLTESIP